MGGKELDSPQPYIPPLMVWHRCPSDAAPVFTLLARSSPPSSLQVMRARALVKGAPGEELMRLKFKIAAAHDDVA